MHKRQILINEITALLTNGSKEKARLKVYDCKPQETPRLIADTAVLGAENIEVEIIYNKSQIKDYENENNK